MSEAGPSLLLWLHRVAGFPARRLPPSAELLLCFASAAQTESETDGAVQNGGPVARRDGARDAALRQHELRRTRVHFKCDNSAKV